VSIREEIGIITRRDVGYADEVIETFKCRTTVLPSGSGIKKSVRNVNEGSEVMVFRKCDE
jgi:hypothetical protein